MTEKRPGAKSTGRSSKTPAPPPTPEVVVEPPVREPTRRLTLDFPERLHKAMKIKAATTGVPIVTEVAALCEKHYEPWVRASQEANPS